MPIDQLETLALSYLWPFLRISALLMIAPIFGAGSVSVRIRVVLAALLSALMAPMLPVNAEIEFFSAPGILMALREIAIGLAMGFVMQMIFGAVVLAGQSIATGMGLGFAMSVDPQNGVQVPIVSQIKVVIATLLFLAIDGHLMLLSAVFQSFELVPLTDTGFAVTSFENVVSLGSQLFASALLLGLPTLTAVLMINVAFGVITRAAPQLNIFAVGFPVTITVGLVFLFLGMPAFVAAMQRFFETGVNQTLMVLG
jgi:flagellar biosynthetic protein FliR